MALLRHTSSNMSHKTSMPSVDEADHVKEEATFKEKQLKTSSQTLERLGVEKERLESDLASIEILDTKIAQERVVLNHKIENMEREIDVFGDMELVRKQSERTMKDLQVFVLISSIDISLCLF